MYCPLTCSHRDECGGKVTGISARPHDTLTQSKFSAESRENCPCVMELSATLGPGTLSAPHRGASVDGGIKESKSFFLYHQDSAPGPSLEQSMGKWSVRADQQNMANQSDPSRFRKLDPAANKPSEPNLIQERQDKHSLTWKL